MWTLEDLKEINKSNSRAYELAIKTEIPDDLARDFKKNLKIFKPQ